MLKKKKKMPLQKTLPGSHSKYSSVENTFDFFDLKIFVETGVSLIYYYVLEVSIKFSWHSSLTFFPVNSCNVEHIF